MRPTAPMIAPPHPTTASNAPGTEDPAIPPGWTYNPSAWADRVLPVGLAIVGLAIATYLSLYQWRVIHAVWDPFFASPAPRFRNGSEVVLNSALSRLLPVPDAFLGALAYAAEIVSGLIGGRARWRTRPWAPLTFGLILALAAATSIVLIVLQPLLSHTWCLLCLCSAAVSLALTLPAADEVLATLQHLRRARKAGRPLWRTLLGLRT